LPNDVGKLSVCSLPDKVQIEIEVGMDKPVAHPDHILPGNCLIALAQFWGEPRCRFSHDLDTADNRMLKWTLPIELLPRQTSNIPHRLPRGIEHMTESAMVGIKQHTG
jgi:hypothetical protein